MNGGFYSGISSLSGTANDTLTGSGVSQVSVAIINGAAEYWNGVTLRATAQALVLPGRPRSMLETRAEHDL